MYLLSFVYRSVVRIVLIVVHCNTYFHLFDYFSFHSSFLMIFRFIRWILCNFISTIASERLQSRIQICFYVSHIILNQSLKQMDSRMALCLSASVLLPIPYSYNAHNTSSDHFQTPSEDQHYSPYTHSHQTPHSPFFPLPFQNCRNV